jgi:hypothetical protein
MDYLLVLLAIGGAVVAGVMLVLASRASRLERESDARVQALQALATGSVLFAAEPFDEFMPTPSSAGTVEALTAAPVATATFDEFLSAPRESDAFDEFDDEASDSPRELVADDAPRAAASVTFERPAPAHPFVMTVPAGGRRPAGSFDRIDLNINHGSRT